MEDCSDSYNFVPLSDFLTMDSSYSIVESDHEDFRFKLLQMQERGELTDVIISVEDTTIPCHKNVLSLASPYFKEAFASDPREEYHLDDLNASAISDLVKYMYIGKIEITVENAEHIFAACQRLQFAQLIEKCENLMVELIDSTNCIGLNKFANKHALTRLADASKECMLNQFESTAKSADFMRMTEMEIMEYIADVQPLMTHQGVVFKAVVRWCKADPEASAELFQKIVKSLRFDLYSRKTLRNVVQKEPLMRSLECQELLVNALLSATDRPKSVISSESESGSPTN